MKIPVLVAAALLAAAGGVHAQGKPRPRTPAKPPVKAQDQTKGAQQVKGGDGVFGTTYTLQSGLNLAVLSARYSIDPYIAYSAETPEADSKFLILTCAIKNSNKDDLFFDVSRYVFTAVDDKNQNYEGYNWRQTSRAAEGFSPTLKPGQGLGQDPTRDAIEVMVKVPAAARIGKLILNIGRATVPDEKVVRYFLAGTQGGNPKNVLQPAPDFIRDPADPTGQAIRGEGAGKLGEGRPSGTCLWRLDKIAFVDGALGDKDPGEGRKFVAATVSFKNVSKDPQQVGYMINNGNRGHPLVLVDTDSEKYEEEVVFKASRDEDIDGGHEIAPGDSYTVRVLVAVPKDVKLKKITYGMPGGYVYTVPEADFPKSP